MSYEISTTHAAPGTNDLGSIQPELLLSRPGVLSYVWHFGYGDILIEVFEDGRVAVNRQEVLCEASIQTRSATRDSL